MEEMPLRQIKLVQQLPGVVRGISTLENNKQKANIPEGQWKKIGENEHAMVNKAVDRQYMGINK